MDDLEGIGCGGGIVGTGGIGVDGEDVVVVIVAEVEVGDVEVAEVDVVAGGASDVVVIVVVKPLVDGEAAVVVARTVVVVDVSFSTPNSRFLPINDSASSSSPSFARKSGQYTLNPSTKGSASPITGSSLSVVRVHANFVCSSPVTRALHNRSLVAAEIFKYPWKYSAWT